MGNRSDGGVLNHVSRERTRISQCVMPWVDVPHVIRIAIPLCTNDRLVKLLGNIIHIPLPVLVPILPLRHVGHPSGVHVCW